MELNELVPQGVHVPISPVAEEPGGHTPHDAESTGLPDPEGHTTHVNELKEYTDPAGSATTEEDVTIKSPCVALPSVPSAHVEWIVMLPAVPMLYNTYLVYPLFTQSLPLKLTA